MLLHHAHVEMIASIAVHERQLDFGKLHGVDLCEVLE